MDPASQRTTLPHFSTTQEFAGIARLSLVKALLVICIYIYIFQSNSPVHTPQGNQVFAQKKIWRSAKNETLHLHSAILFSQPNPNISTFSVKSPAIQVLDLGPRWYSRKPELPQSGSRRRHHLDPLVG